MLRRGRMTLRLRGQRGLRLGRRVRVRALDGLGGAVQPGVPGLEPIKHALDRRLRVLVDVRVRLERREDLIEVRDQAGLVGGEAVDEGLDVLPVETSGAAAGPVWTVGLAAPAVACAWPVV